MPTDPVVWIVLIVVVGAVIALALWLGRGLRVKGRGIDLKVESDKSMPDSGVTVFKQGKVGERARVGNITGVRLDHGRGQVPGQDVAVANQTEIQGKVGDITGVAITTKKPEGR
jgi:hypothetical protein